MARALQVERLAGLPGVGRESVRRSRKSRDRATMALHDKNAQTQTIEPATPRVDDHQLSAPELHVVVPRCSAGKSTARAAQHRRAPRMMGLPVLAA